MKAHDTLRNVLLLLATVALSISCSTPKQQTRPAQNDKHKLIDLINLLPEDIRSNSFEYSSLTVWQDNLILLPQWSHKSALEKACVYRLKPAANKTLEAYRLPIQNLTSLPERIVNHWEGFEALTTVENTFFFAIETDSLSDSCYVIKGIIKNNTIEINTKYILPLSKPWLKEPHEKIKNAGFESLTYLKASRKLIALFEFNRETDLPTACVFDTGFGKIEFPWMDSLPFRLTDVFCYDKNSMYGLVHYWSGEPVYFGKFKCNNSVTINSCYSSIIELNFENDSIHWDCVMEIKSVGNSSNKDHRCINWEGIALKKDSFYVINDEYGFKESVLMKYPK